MPAMPPKMVVETPTFCHSVMRFCRSSSACFQGWMVPPGGIGAYLVPAQNACGADDEIGGAELNDQQDNDEFFHDFNCGLKWI